MRPLAVAPAALRVLSAASGREIVRLPLGEAAEQRYGAPYWLIHRGDLQAALMAACSRQMDLTVKLGTRVEDYVTHSNGITLAVRAKSSITDERGLALLAADGLWSVVRKRIGDAEPPRFAGRVAWRASVPAPEVAPEFREPLVHLWLGRHAHLVHYPVKAGSIINMVVVTADAWNAPGWSEPANRADLLARLEQQAWPLPARSLIGLPERWLKWALYERRPIRQWSKGRVALLGDAAHAMLPFLAQGAAMAIEDAAVAARCLARHPDDPDAALRIYCAVRRGRIQKVQRLAARTGARYHLGGARAWLRDLVLRTIGGTRLLHHHDWLYDWRPPAAFSLK